MYWVPADPNPYIMQSAMSWSATLRVHTVCTVSSLNIVYHQTSEASVTSLRIWSRFSWTRSRLSFWIPSNRFNPITVR